MGVGEHKVKPQVRVPGEQNIILVGLDLPEVTLVLKE